jgi:hypothetical protein
MVIEGTIVTENAIVVVTPVNNIQRVRLYLDCVKLPSKTYSYIAIL